MGLLVGICTTSRSVSYTHLEEDNSRTVDSHIKTLRLKLGDAACEPRFIQTVRGTGYRLMRGEQP